MIPFVSRIDQHELAEWLEAFPIFLPDEEVVPFSALSDGQKLACDVAIVANPDPQELMQLPNLKWVQSVWAGVERMVNETPTPTFDIVRLVDPNLTETMSEAVLAWTLYLHREMPAYARQQQQIHWHQRPMVRAKDRHIGILGLGELGRVSAERLVANGFSVSGWSRSAKEIAGVQCFSGEEGLDALLQQSNILVCLLPLTSQTKGILKLDSLLRLPKGATLINFARGAIIEDDALLQALEEGHIQHAVLDVFTQEPLPSSHPYWTHPNVTVLPHISAPSDIKSGCQIVADNIFRYRKTGKKPEVVDLKRGY